MATWFRLFLPMPSARRTHSKYVILLACHVRQYIHRSSWGFVGCGWSLLFKDMKPAEAFSEHCSSSPVATEFFLGQAPAPGGRTPKKHGRRHDPHSASGHYAGGVAGRSPGPFKGSSKDSL